MIKIKRDLLLLDLRHVCDCHSLGKLLHMPDELLAEILMQRLDSLWITTCLDRFKQAVK